MQDNPKGIEQKVFVQNEYNGPSSQDYLDRLGSLFCVFEGECLDSDADDVKREALINLYHQYVESLDKIQFPEDYQQLGTPASKESLKKGLETLQNFVMDATKIVHPEYVDGHSKKEYQDFKRELMRKESEMVAQKGRPDFDYRYFSGNQTRISAQHSIGHTIPSTERLGESSQLPNFSKCSVGYLDGDKESPTYQFEGYRHSSYPPIREENSFKRHQKAAKIAKTMLEALADEALADENTKSDGVIELKLTSLGLLSPHQLLDFVIANFSSPDEVEQRQLQESYHALMLYQGRAFTFKGRQFKLEATMANIPMNEYGVWLDQRSCFDTALNAEAMNAFILRGSTHFADLFGFYGFENYAQTSDLLKASETKLIDYRYELETALNDHNQKGYDHAMEKINKEMKICERMHLEQWKRYQKHFKAKRPDLIRVLNELEKSSTMDDKQKAFQLFLQTVIMSIDRGVEPAQFGARYLLANQKMGQKVDFFCKSGEDRTGRMQNMIEELCIFEKEKGYYPRYDHVRQNILTEDSNQQATIALTVSRYSTSLAIANANVPGARGLQLSGALPSNQGLACKESSMVGTLAKKVFGKNYPSFLKHHTPSRTWVQYFRSLFYPSQTHSNHTPSVIVTDPQNGNDGFQNRNN